MVYLRGCCVPFLFLANSYTSFEIHPNITSPWSHPCGPGLSRQPVHTASVQIPVFKYSFIFEPLVPVSGADTEFVFGEWGNGWIYNLPPPAVTWAPFSVAQKKNRNQFVTLGEAGSLVFTSNACFEKVLCGPRLRRIKCSHTSVVGAQKDLTW